MSQFPCMPFWTDAYLGDTGHLTTQEHGAYLLLLIAMWRAPENKLPNDDKRLARYAKMDGRQWRHIRETIMEFMTVEDGFVMQGRLLDEAQFVREHSRKQSINAKARWLKVNKTFDAMAMPEPCQTDAKQMPPNPSPLSLSLSLRSREVTHEKVGSAKGSRLDPEWEPGPYRYEEILAAGKDWDSVLENFRDYWIAQPGRQGVKLDWQRTWNRWIRTELERKTNGHDIRPNHR